MSQSIRTIILRVTQGDYERIAKWKTKAESWEQYVIALVELIENEVYGGEEQK